MKNRYSLFIMGTMLVFVCGCQPTMPKASEPSQTNVNPQQSDNEDDDGDDGAYGDKDTSSHREAEDASPIFPTDPVAEIDAQQILIDQAIEQAAVVLADTIVEVDGDNSLVILEAVDAIELPSEFAMVEETVESQEVESAD
jgi:hypothetical protein